MPQALLAMTVASDAMEQLSHWGWSPLRHAVLKFTSGKLRRALGAMIPSKRSAQLLHLHACKPLPSSLRRLPVIMCFFVAFWFLSLALPAISFNEHSRCEIVDCSRQRDAGFCAELLPLPGQRELVDTDTLGETTTHMGRGEFSPATDGYADRNNSSTSMKQTDSPDVLSSNLSSTSQDDDTSLVKARESMPDPLTSGTLSWQDQTLPVRSCPRLTIFSAPAASNVSTYVQTRALLSWLRLRPAPRVVLLGHHPSLHSLAAQFPGRVSVDSSVDTNFEGSPLLRSVLERIQHHHSSADAAKRAPYSRSRSPPTGSACQLAMLVDPDVILFNDVIFAARKVASRFHRFVLAGVSWDVPSFPFSHSRSRSLPVSGGSAAAAAAVALIRHHEWVHHWQAGNSTGPGDSSRSSSDASQEASTPTSSDDPAITPLSARRAADEQDIRSFVRGAGTLNLAGPPPFFLWSHPGEPLRLQRRQSVSDSEYEAVPSFTMGGGGFHKWLLSRLVRVAQTTGSSSSSSSDTLSNTSLSSSGAVVVNGGARQVVDVSEAVTCVRVFSEEDAAREAERAAAATVMAAGGDEAGGKNHLQEEQRDRQRWEEEGAGTGGSVFTPSQEGGTGGGSAGGKVWEDSSRPVSMPGGAGREWEVHVNALLGAMSKEDEEEEEGEGGAAGAGSVSTAAWQLVTCHLAQGESMCLLRLVRPGNCSCHTAVFSPTNTTADVTVLQDAWVTCGQVRAKQRGQQQAGAGAAAGAPAEAAAAVPVYGSVARGEHGGVEEAVGRVLSAVGVPVHAYLALRERLARGKGVAEQPQEQGDKKAGNQQLQQEGQEEEEAVAWNPSQSHSLLALLPRVTAGHAGATVVMTATSMQQLPATLSFVCRLRSLNVSSIVILATDQPAYATALLLSLPVFFSPSLLYQPHPSASQASLHTQEQQDQQQEAQLQQAQNRPAIAAAMREVVRAGYACVWADSRALWLANPLPALLEQVPAKAIGVQMGNVPPAPSWWRASGPSAASKQPGRGSTLASSSLVLARAGREEEQALQEVAKVADVMWRERHERVERREWEEGSSFFLALCASGSSCQSRATSRLVFLDPTAFPPASAAATLWSSRNAAFTARRQGRIILPAPNQTTGADGYHGFLLQDSPYDRRTHTCQYKK